jgi:glycine/D-amino acid oxidase-like deaminating enzyme
MTMGIFSALLLAPLAPVRGAAWVAQQVADEADRQLYDESRIRRDLLQLELDYDDGLIDDEQRASQEDILLERLALAKRWEQEERRAPTADGEQPLNSKETIDG